MSLTGKAAIVGIYEMPPVKSAEGLDVLSLNAEVARGAIQDAGIDKSEIDGIVTCLALGDLSTIWPSQLVEYLGLDVNFMDSVSLGGASPAGMVLRAAMAIQAGLCETVLCVCADIWELSAIASIPSPHQDREFLRPYGFVGPNASYALMAQRHMFEHGTTSEQLAKIAVDQRVNANHNPAALFHQQSLTIDDVLSSKMVADPLHIYEIVMPCSGGGAFIMTRHEKVKDHAHTGVYLLGAGEHCSRHSVVYRHPITTTAIKHTAKKAFSMAGLLPEDMDFVQLYDCYTILVLMSLEDAGFCLKGRGGPFVMDHDLTFLGDFPCNTHGGQLSFGQPGIAGGLSQVLEATRQLMGRADVRQIHNAQFGFVNGNGGTTSEEVSLVLGRV